MYSPGYGGCYLNRNRNSRSVLGIDYTIARARAAHMNRIKDNRRIFYRKEKEEEAEKGWKGKEGERKEEVIASSLISSMHENKSNLCIRTWRMTLSAGRSRNRRNESKTRRDCSFLRSTKSGTIAIAKLTR